LSHPCGENFSFASLCADSKKVANSKSRIAAIKRYFLVPLQGKKVSTSCSWAKDKGWGDLLRMAWLGVFFVTLDITLILFSVFSFLFVAMARKNKGKMIYVPKIKVLELTLILLRKWVGNLSRMLGLGLINACYRNKFL
jgi:hypothetical protein